MKENYQCDELILEPGWILRSQVALLINDPFLEKGIIIAELAGGLICTTYY
jgi:hypothetical protein